MFSVVIPLFDKAQMVGRVLDSVLRQTCRPAEVIVVNDGSTAGGERIARERDPAGDAFRVIDQPNGGVSRARNAGLRAASHAFVSRHAAVQPPVAAAMGLPRCLRGSKPARSV